MAIKRVLLLDTSIASNNIGDEIINDSIHQNWRELYDGNYVSRFPSHTPPYSWWQQLFFKKKIESLKKADYIFLCGTNALYTNMLRPLPVWNVHLWNAPFYKGTILLGVGAGINSSKVNAYTRNLYKKILNRDYIHSVRDEYTKDMLVSLGYRAYNTGCPTLWGLTSERVKTIPTSKSHKVVFTLTSYHPDIDCDRAMIEILRQEYDQLYFWPQTITDYEYVKSLCDIDFISIPPNLSAYDKLLSSDIDYVGNRLHGGIRALQHGRRTVIVAIDYRARNFKKSYSLPIIERKDIMKELRFMINSNFKTEITGLDWDLIESWKSQFGMSNVNPVTGGGNLTLSILCEPATINQYQLAA